VLAFGQPTVPERGVVRVTLPILEFYTSSERLKLASSNFMCLKAISSVTLRKTDHLWKGRFPGHVIHLRILHPLKFLWNCWR